MKAFEKPVYVNKPFLPPISEFISAIEPIWEDSFVTNFGPRHRLFEKELMAYLGVQHLSLCSNGTAALELALKSLPIRGKVLTTPFSFVASTHAIVASGLQPVFCDIEPNHFNLDPGAVEANISSEVGAILAVHTFGAPCDVMRFSELSERHGIPVIYDAAHAFGVKLNGQSILDFGDVSALSLHATKPLHTFEGGFVVAANSERKAFIDRMINFGFEADGDVSLAATNAKLSDIHAAMGSLLLSYIDGLIEHRLNLIERYRTNLGGRPDLSLSPVLGDDVRHNGAFFAIRVDCVDGQSRRDALLKYLHSHNVIAKKYFSPLISQMQLYKNLGTALPKAEKVEREILVLPVHFDLSLEDIDTISELITGFLSDVR